MNVQYNLRIPWHNYVASGQAVSEFEAKEARENLWSVGNWVRVGLMLGLGGSPEFFALNATTGKELDLSVLSVDIEAGFVKRHIAHRSLRPGAVSAKPPGRGEDLPESLQDCGFGCNDPNHPWSLLKREAFAVIKMARRHWACYANFSPFEEEGHFLWLPAEMHDSVLVLPHILQKIDIELLEDALALSRACSDHMVFYNGEHSGNSRAHYHLQAVYVRDRLPIETAVVEVSSSGREYLSGYPIEVLTFGPDRSAAEVYACINALVKAGKSYNLITLRGRTYLVPREPNHEIVVEFPFGVLASMEMAGRLILADAGNFQNTTWADVVSAFRKSGLTRDEIESLMG